MKSIALREIVVFHEASLRRTWCARIFVVTHLRDYALCRRPRLSGRGLCGGLCCDSSAALLRCLVVGCFGCFGFPLKCAEASCSPWEPKTYHVACLLRQLWHPRGTLERKKGDSGIQAWISADSDAFRNHILKVVGNL